MSLCSLAVGSSLSPLWVPLTRYPLIQAEQGWGVLGVNHSVQGARLRLGDRWVEGFGTHAPGRLVFDLGGRCTRFRVRLDIDREVAFTKKGSVDFQIVGDGRKLFDSGVQHVGDSRLPALAQVDVSGVKVLELISGDGGDGNDSDQADWLEPQVVEAPDPHPNGVPASRKVRADGIKLFFEESGQPLVLRLSKPILDCTYDARTRLAGETTMSSTEKKLKGGGEEFVRQVKVGKRRCRIRETFRPNGDSIRWQVELLSNDPAWSVPISTVVRLDPRLWKIWMPWNDPLDSRADLTMGSDKGPWHDPLVPQPFRDRMYTYGENANANWWTGDIVTLPMVTLLNEKQDVGVSLIQSPEDPLPTAQIATGKSNWFAFNRLNCRLGEGKPVRFTMYIGRHAADPKAALGWVARRFPRYFNPPNPSVAGFGGCGAYSGDDRNLDAPAVRKLRQMAFKTMWKLSDDNAYMGMYIPPVHSPDEQWQRTEDPEAPANYKPLWMNTRRVNNYAQMLKSNGFHLLSYFNAVEFGLNLKEVSEPVDKRTPDLWKDSSRYLKAWMPNAPLRPNGKQPEGAWQGGWVLDPGDPAFRQHLLTQIDRHLQWVPASEGVCIDRMDYLVQFNDLANDGISYHNGKPSRALVTSWKNLMDQLGPKMHRAGKVIFANLMDPRLDLAQHLDGLYAEFGNQTTVINGLSFVCLNKPLLAWTRDNDRLSDEFFQRHLYLGAFPTAPYPTNNHCIQPSPDHDRWYSDYGPLFSALGGRKWVLLAHVVSVEGSAKVNLFSVPGGYALPVTFASGQSQVRVRLNRILFVTRRSTFEVITPGSGKTIKLSAKTIRGATVLDVPVERGCALVRIQTHNR